VKLFSVQLEWRYTRSAVPAERKLFAVLGAVTELFNLHKIKSKPRKKPSGPEPLKKTPATTSATPGAGDDARDCDVDGDEGVGGDSSGDDVAGDAGNEKAGVIDEAAATILLDGASGDGSGLSGEVDDDLLGDLAAQVLERMAGGGEDEAEGLFEEYVRRDIEETGEADVAQGELRKIETLIHGKGTDGLVSKVSHHIDGLGLDPTHPFDDDDVFDDAVLEVGVHDEPLISSAAAASSSAPAACVSSHIATWRAAALLGSNILENRRVTLEQGIPVGGLGEPCCMSLMSSGTEVFLVQWAPPLPTRMLGRRINIHEGRAKFWIPGTPSVSFRDCKIVHPATGAFLAKTKKQHEREQIPPNILRLKHMWEVAESRNRDIEPALADTLDVCHKCGRGGGEKLYCCPWCLLTWHTRCAESVTAACAADIASMQKICSAVPSEFAAGLCKVIVHCILLSSGIISASPCRHHRMKVADLLLAASVLFLLMRCDTCCILDFDIPD
jgi:hypothetical protein